MAQGAIYRYFENKRDLLLKVIEHCCEAMLSDDHRQLAGVSGARNRLRFMIWPAISRRSATIPRFAIWRFAFCARGPATEPRMYSNGSADTRVARWPSSWRAFQRGSSGPRSPGAGARHDLWLRRTTHVGLFARRRGFRSKQDRRCDRRSCPWRPSAGGQAARGYRRRGRRLSLDASSSGLKAGRSRSTEWRRAGSPVRKG